MLLEALRTLLSRFQQFLSLLSDMSRRLNHAYN